VSSKPLLELINTCACKCCSFVSKRVAKANFPLKSGQRRMHSNTDIQIHGNRISVTDWCFVTAAYPYEVGDDNG
jgi:hypothetical protein